jgi:CRP-like cAMP-binding protein
MREQAGANHLLAGLASEELDQLLVEAEVLELERHEPLIAPGLPIRFVYFPINCLGSLVAVLDDGSTVEAGTVGREGMVGVPVILDAKTTPMETVVQVPGRAVRIPSARLKEIFDRGGSLRVILNRYIHFLFVTASQSAACNRRHQIEQRLARWLLMSADGVGSEKIAITHEYLAVMLGVRRPSVSEAALSLQARGVIHYGRASVEIVDRPGLEAIACECYRIVRNEQDRVVGST